MGRGMCQRGSFSFAHWPVYTCTAVCASARSRVSTAVGRDSRGAACGPRAFVYYIADRRAATHGHHLHPNIERVSTHYHRGGKRPRAVYMAVSNGLRVKATKTLHSQQVTGTLEY